MQYYLSCLWIRKALSPILIAITAIIGDRFVSSARLSHLQKAVVDNVTHALIGFETWYCLTVICPFKYRLAHELLESMVCGILSSIIDVDHFIAAKSVHLEDAVRLESRPFLHCTSVLLGVCAVLLLTGHLCNVSALEHACWLVAAAVLSHHVRDATRRGLFMWPFGATPPIPYTLYICLSAALPFVIAALFTITHQTKLHHIEVWEV